MPLVARAMAYRWVREKVPADASGPEALFYALPGKMLREVTSGLKNVEVGTFRGLLVEFCRVNSVSAIVKPA